MKIKSNQAINSSPFNLLPDELMMKIINLVLEDCKEYWYCPGSKQDLLVNTIAKISWRFKRLTEDKSFWRRKVWISGDVPLLKVVIQDFLNSGVEDLFVKYCSKLISSSSKQSSKQSILAADLRNMALACPELENLDLQHFAITSWPSLSVPWRSMKRLIINTANPKCFENVDFSDSIPNIEYLTIASSGVALTVLPDMSNCCNLQEVFLEGGAFSFPGKIPLPRNLKRMCGSWDTPVAVNCDEVPLEDYFEDCDISDLEFVKGGEKSFEIGRNIKLHQSLQTY